MLDAIADFWKPVKRLQAQTKLKADELQVGSQLVFGFVPQPSLSGRRFSVTAINTYKFGADVLTSFVLSQDKDAGASMIIADTGGEQYIAVSRRIATNDREKLFNPEDIDAVLSYAEAKNIRAKDVPGDYKGWVAPQYKREIHGVKGQLYKGDHRGGLISGQGAMDFTYTLMVSDNNEHALEIEKYDDGHVEIYATVYRRMSDVGEVSHPDKKELADKSDAVRPEMKLVSGGAPAVIAVTKPAPVLGESVPPPPIPEKNVTLETRPQAVPSAPQTIPEGAREPDVQEAVVSTPMKLPEFPAEAVAKKQAVEVPPPPKAPVSITTEASPLDHAQLAAIIKTKQQQPYIKQEIKAVSNEPSNFVNESIDCELHVANKIIDEAIRQEMRINDVVRKVIGLPVAQQESVQIPVTLTDQDYALLAIRYGISAGDHEAIKKRIIEDLGDFSGSNKQRKAA